MRYFDGNPPETLRFGSALREYRKLLAQSDDNPAQLVMRDGQISHHMMARALE